MGPAADDRSEWQARLRRAIRRWRAGRVTGEDNYPAEAGTPPGNFASPAPVMPDPLPPVNPDLYLAVGKLRRPHGVRGDLLMEVLTDFPERLHVGRLVYIGDDHRPLQIRSRRPHAQGLLIAFQGIDTPEAAGLLRNCLVQVRAMDVPPLPEGEYYHHQLIGLQVVDEAGTVLGILKEILETGANEVYVVQPPAGLELLLPAIPDVIRQVDLRAGMLHVHILPGLIP